MFPGRAAQTLPVRVPGVQRKVPRHVPLSVSRGFTIHCRYSSGPGRTLPSGAWPSQRCPACACWSLGFMGRRVSGQRSQKPAACLTALPPPRRRRGLASATAIPAGAWLRSSEPDAPSSALLDSQAGRQQGSC